MKLTLMLFPDGKAVLSTPENVTQREAVSIREAFERFRRTPEGVLVCTQCEVLTATDIELDLPAPGLPHSIEPRTKNENESQPVAEEEEPRTHLDPEYVWPSQPVAEEGGTWPSRDDFNRMTTAEVNDFLASHGFTQRVVDEGQPVAEEGA